MVKVVERTKEERELEGITQDLLEFSRPLLKGKELSVIGGKCIYVDYGEIVIFPTINEVKLNDAKHYDIAFELTEAYEQKTEEEWTLRLNY